MQYLDHPSRPWRAESHREGVIARYFRALSDRDADGAAALLTEDHVTSRPQSGEVIQGSRACVRAHLDDPGGSPRFDLLRIRGCDGLWTAELTADYGSRRVAMVSLLDFRGSRIDRQTEYFGEAFAQPDWRQAISRLEGPLPPPRQVVGGAR
jgi:hypothetical protein